MSIAPSSGYFAGYFGYPGASPLAGAANTANPVSTPPIRTAFVGVIFQKKNIGGGFYLAGAQSGTVSVAAAPLAPPVTASTGQ